MPYSIVDLPTPYVADEVFAPKRNWLHVVAPSQDGCFVAEATPATLLLIYDESRSPLWLSFKRAKRKNAGSRMAIALKTNGVGNL